MFGPLLKFIITIQTNTYHSLTFLNMQTQRNTCNTTHTLQQLQAQVVV